MAETSVERAPDTAFAVPPAASSGTSLEQNPGDDRHWTKAFAPYREPRTLRSSVELAITAAPFILFWAAAMVLVGVGFWWGVFFALPAAAFLIRLFMIQHDCGHGAFFRRRRTNDWIGRIIGVFTLTPYEYWRRTHAVHHATGGNLDQRGMGDVVTLTVNEYRAMSRWGRFCYRLYRHPAFLLIVGSAVTFLLKHRVPMGVMRAGLWGWTSTMGTNLAIAVVTGLLIWAVGAGPFFLVQLPITLIAGAVGIWLFFIQHQFEETHWAEGDEWNFHTGALHGSSHYDLPGVLRWFTANVGIHHVHHLASRIPFYRLRQVLRDFPELRERGRLTLLKSFHSAKLALWDQVSHRLISFREASAMAA